MISIPKRTYTARSIHNQGVSKKNTENRFDSILTTNKVKVLAFKPSSDDLLVFLTTEGYQFGHPKVERPSSGRGIYIQYFMYD